MLKMAGQKGNYMDRTVKEFRKSKRGYAEVVVMDVRDLFYGEYSVERLVGGDGYTMVFSHRDLNKCLEKAHEIFNRIQAETGPRAVAETCPPRPDDGRASGRVKEAARASHLLR